MNIDQPGSQSFYLALAAKDHAAADAGVLANVRDKHLASAATWEGLASLAGRTAAGRDARAIIAPADARPSASNSEWDAAAGAGR